MATVDHESECQTIFLIQCGIVGEDVDEIPSWDYVETEVAAALDHQTIHLGWLLMSYFMNQKSLSELDQVCFVPPPLVHAVAASDAIKVGLDVSGCETALKAMLKKDAKMFLFPISAGFHWTLLVLDKVSQTLRYYDSGLGSDEDKEIGTEKEILAISDATLAVAEKLLGELLRLECIDQQLLSDAPPLRRHNEKIRQPRKSNMCGHFLLAFAEEVALECIGYGPSAAGWPFTSAFEWKARN